LKLFNDRLCENSELNVGVLIVKVLGELGDALRVCLGLEPEPFAFEKCFQLFVIGDDAVMNNRKFPVWVRSVKNVSAFSGAYRMPRTTEPMVRSLGTRRPYLWGWQLRRDG